MSMSHTEKLEAKISQLEDEVLIESEYIKLLEYRQKVADEMASSGTNIMKAAR